MIITKRFEKIVYQVKFRGSEKYCAMAVSSESKLPVSIVMDEVQKFSSFYHENKKNKSSSTVLEILANILKNIFLILCPLAMIIIGGIFVDECEVDKRIPIYLIVQGIAFLLVYVLYSRKSKDFYDLRSCLFATTSIFFVTWFLLGTIWIYRGRTPNFDPTAGPHCHQGLYEFAFWINTMYLVAFAVIICLHKVCCRRTELF